jgi:hypothetical protein
MSSEHPLPNFTLDGSLEVLERTPAALRALLYGLNGFWTHRNYGEKTFGPFDVVGHLIEADETNWMPRAWVILEHGETKAFPGFDRYAMYEKNKGKQLLELLETFANLRSKNLADFRAMKLTEAQLDRAGTHPEFGRVTLRQLLATWVVHDLNHLHQIAKSMAFQYRDEVGPWRDRLSILPPST